MHFQNVDLDDRFENGNRNEDFHVDLPHMTADEKACLARFITGVLSGNPHLLGRNKESWTNEKGVVIDRCKTYKKLDIWHYHCGPYGAVHGVKTATDLSRNLAGRTSSAVIHYVKDQSRKRVIVIGFSRKHIPFPDGESTKNPLRQRGHIVQAGIKIFTALGQRLGGKLAMRVMAVFTVQTKKATC